MVRTSYFPSKQLAIFFHFSGSILTDFTMARDRIAVHPVNSLYSL